MLLGRNLNSTQTWTIYAGMHVYADFNSSGSLTMRYLILPGMQVPFARMDASNNVGWYLMDAAGSVREVTDTSGNVLDYLVYGNFGNVLSETFPANGDRFKFGQMEFDAGLGINHAGARWQSPGAGNFLSEDPIGFAGGTFNIYSYVGNSPTNWIDPQGLWSIGINPDAPLVRGWKRLWNGEAYEDVRSGLENPRVQGVGKLAGGLTATASVVGAPWGLGEVFAAERQILTGVPQKWSAPGRLRGHVIAGVVEQFPLWL